MNRKLKLTVIDAVDELVVKPNHIYIERRDNKDRWAYLKCPCGCGDIISVNLMKSVYPHWGIDIKRNDLITISPSLNKTTGCKSHFFVRDSEINWA